MASLEVVLEKGDRKHSAEEKQELAAEKLGLKPKECLVVEDAKAGIVYP